MAELAGVFASSHAPLVVRGWKDVKPVNQQNLTRAYDELGKRMKAARPDVIVEIAPDHWVNFFINNLPSICVGIGEEHEGPGEPWMKDCPYKTIAGHPRLASHIVETALEHDFEPSVSHHLTLDHGFAIPLWKGGLNPLPPIVPIIFNDLEPPYPTVRRCLAWGAMLADAVRSYPENIRVAIPLEQFVSVTGASGSGKSSLIHAIVQKRLYSLLHDSRVLAGEHDELTGSEHISDVIDIDQ